MARTPAIKSSIELQPTNMKHVYLCDVHDTGLLREIILLKQAKDGTIYYIDIAPLHPIDKSRFKQILSSQHADKYEAWELFAQMPLSNGMNALDYAHSNFIQEKRPAGARAAGGSLSSVEAYSGGLGAQIGAEFSDPASASKQQG